MSGRSIPEKKFTGKERDQESGNDYFGARYYASTMGRWMSPDPINLTNARLMNPANTLNKYAYGANNPLKYVDPDGKDITLYYRAPSGGATDFGHVMLGVLAQQQPTNERVRGELTSLASAYGVPSNVILATAKTESNFDVNAVNDNLNSKGQVTSTDYGVMQVNSRNIGGTATGPDGKPFTITDSIKSDWKANANAGVAIAAQEYRAAIKSQPNGTAETRAQQTYSGYNAGPGGRSRYTETGSFHGFADKRDYNFLMNYRSQ